MPGKRKSIQYVLNENGCHICTSHAPGTYGYPKLSVKNRPANMHRVLYEEKFGSIGPLVARHTCDNTLCINLDHVIPGTVAQNVDDKVRRGRCNPPRGERSGTAKLTAAEVQFIRESDEAQRVLADRFKIDQSQVSRIKTRKRWTA